MKTIRLSKPVVKKIGDDKTQWSCTISGDFLNDSLYYQVENKWAPYLVENRLDAAVVAMIPYAMYRSTEEEPVELVCDAPISERLYFQLTSELIPALAKECGWYNRFKMRCDLSSEKYDSTAVLTSVSGGGIPFIHL